MQGALIGWLLGLPLLASIALLYAEPATARASQAPMHQRAIEDIAPFLRDYRQAPAVRFRLIAALPAVCAQQPCAAEREKARQTVEALLAELLRSDLAMQSLLASGRIEWIAEPQPGGVPLLRLQVIAPPPPVEAACPAQLQLHDPRLGREAPIALIPGSLVHIQPDTTVRIKLAQQAGDVAWEARLQSLGNSVEDKMSRRASLRQPVEWVLPETGGRLTVTPGDSPRLVGNVLLPFPQASGGSTPAACEWRFMPAHGR